jgi:hypothetical protein
LPSYTTTFKRWWSSKERIGDAFVHSGLRTREVKDLLQLVVVVQDLCLTLPQQALLLALELLGCNGGTGVRASMHHSGANMHHSMASLCNMMQRGNALRKKPELHQGLRIQRPWAQRNRELR